MLEKYLLESNAIDYSGYPDCRAEFLKSFEHTIALGTKPNKVPMKIYAPLIHMSKGEIVKQAQELGVPFEKTWSCYMGEETPCGKCDSCLLRAKGFEQAKIDPP